MPATPSTARITAVLLVSCLPMGCGSNVKLAAIPSPHLSLYLPTHGDTVVLQITPNGRLLKDGTCKLLAPGAQATLNGLGLARMRGQQSSDDLAYNRDCIVEFTISIDAIQKSGPRASFRIWDESVSWTFELPTAFAPRSFALVSPNRTNVRRGEQIALSWSPPTDVLDRRWAAFGLVRAGSSPGPGEVIRDIEVKGSALSFSIPALPSEEPAWSGPASLQFLGVPGVEPEHTPCPVARCSVSMSFVVPSLDITLEN